MRQLLSKQLMNLLFVVLVVAAALTVYFLSRSQALVSAGASPDSPAPTPADTASPEPVFSGVPESVFITHLQTSELYSAEPWDNQERAWMLTCNSSPVVYAELTYRVERGAVVWFELAFPLSEEYDAHSASAIERYLAANTEDTTAARCEAVRTLLTDLIPACDADGTLPAASARIWAEEAVQIRKDTDSYDDREPGCAFLAFQTRRADCGLLVCEFYIET